MFAELPAKTTLQNVEDHVAEIAVGRSGRHSEDKADLAVCRHHDGIECDLIGGYVVAASSVSAWPPVNATFPRRLVAIADHRPQHVTRTVSPGVRFSKDTG